MIARAYFDDSLPAFAEVVAEQWGRNGTDRNIFLRDASGRLTLVVLDPDKDVVERHALGKIAAQRLGSYVDSAQYAVMTPDELFDDSLKNPEGARRIVVANLEVRLIDRRVVGADWLQTPTLREQTPVRMVFASLKGGVGRSTALCVLAAHLASRGRRVLALDMDLEAPGLGNLLLSSETLPEFGLLDYLVERGIGIVDPEFLLDMVGPSWLGGGRGRVDVIPAVGRRSLANPQNVLSKIARAYLAGVELGREKTSFTTHMRDLVQQVAQPTRYDVVLIDARAGLHETTASAILGLGAEVFLFGTDQPQTLAGFRLLLAHLGTLPTAEGDWRDRLRVVQAKAQLGTRSEFSSAVEALLEEYLYRQESGEFKPDMSDLKSTFDVEWDDFAPNANIIDDDYSPELAISISEDENFRIFDPSANREILDRHLYEAAFGEFLDVASSIVDEGVLGLSRNRE
jgi:Mrp family chromosome partitioning ATPase